MGEPTTDKLADVLAEHRVLEDYFGKPFQCLCGWFPQLEDKEWEENPRVVGPTAIDHQADAIRAALADGSLSPADFGMEQAEPFDFLWAVPS